MELVNADVFIDSVEHIIKVVKAYTGEDFKYRFVKGVMLAEGMRFKKV